MGFVTDEEKEKQAELQEKAADQARSDEAAEVIDILNAKEFKEDERKAALREASQNILMALMRLPEGDLPAERQAIRKCIEFAEDVLKSAKEGHAMRSLYEQVVALGQSDQGHAAFVSAFAVILALGIGYTEQKIIADLSFGGLLHDVGFVDVDPKVFAKTLGELNALEKAEYQSHIQRGLDLLQQIDVKLTENVKTIILQHHERFDGTGFPKRLKEDQISHIAQLVAIASYLSDLRQGHVDGVRHSIQESLRRLSQFNQENQKIYNPSLLNSIQALLRDEKLEERKVANG